MRDLLLIQAFQQVALSFHGNQVRKKKINGFELPYFYHPMSVGQLVWEWGAGSPVNLMASSGHDVFEDCDVDAEYFEKLVVQQICKSSIEAASDPQIKQAINLIIELTFLEKKPGECDCCAVPDKAAYLESFWLKSIDSLIIKVADRYKNVNDFYIGGDAKYALKYFNKAQVLFDICDARKDEILYKNTYSRIKHHHHNLLTLLTCTVNQ